MPVDRTTIFVNTDGTSPPRVNALVINKTVREIESLSAAMNKTAKDVEFLSEMIASLVLALTTKMDKAGVTDASNAAPGIIGEIISANLPVASKITLTTGVAADIVSISLSPGDWDIDGVVYFDATIKAEMLWSWANTVSVTMPSQDQGSVIFDQNTANGQNTSMTLPTWRLNSSTPQTVYLTCRGDFISGTLSACGGIRARRVR
jgi:hypothetical protein